MFSGLIEHRVNGPPGTGKTTYVSRQVGLAVDAWRRRNPGASMDRCRDVLVASLTKAAAAEIKGRVPLSDECVGTLHAHAFRALGCPPLCVDPKSLAEWSKVCRAEHRLSGMKRSDPDGGDDKAGAEPGDEVCEEYHTCRARLLDPLLWPVHVRAFAAEYDQWKRVAHVLDFSDVIDQAYTDCETAPGAPSVIFVDEAQDSSRAELRLVRSWAAQAERLILVGDPDQNLYEWRGSDPEAFYETEIPPENQRVLSQSYRVPRAVHAKAMSVIQRCPERRPIDYFPREADGEVVDLDSSMQGATVEDTVDEIEMDLAAGKTVMALASCEYQLRDLIGELRDRGVPFHNQYARDRGGFNPLFPAKGVGTAQRVLNYLRPDGDVWGDDARLWTGAELASWASVMAAKDSFVHGSKAAIEKFGKENPHAIVAVDWFDEHLSSEAPRDLVGTIDGLPWFQARLAKEKERGIGFAVRVLKRKGAVALKERPKLTIGTIHSVKGGEADCVYLSPSMSSVAWEQYEINPSPTYRLFYVAMTRAREKLVLCGEDYKNKFSRTFDW